MKGHQGVRLLCFTMFVCAACGQKTNIDKGEYYQPSAKNTYLTNDALEKKMAGLRRIIDKHKNNNNEIKANRLQIEFNYYTELKNALNGIGECDREIIDSKYKLLRQIYEDSISGLQEEGVKNSIKIDYDKPYLPPFTASYHPLVLEQVQRVFTDFGDLYINETVNEDGSIAAQELKVQQPWSGYWYPFRDPSLYSNPDSPLVKLDNVLRKLGVNSSIAEKEKQTYSLYSADSWEGLCDAWALASVAAPEPTKEREIYGVKFSAADQKALLTFSHSKFPYTQYGITYRGDADTDGTYQDIMPEAFHKIVTHVLGHEKRPLVIDEAAGVEVWNKPLYRYRWQVTKEQGMDYALYVKAFPWLINQRTSVSNAMTSVSDIIAPIYEYRLYIDRNVTKNGKFHVIAGQWLKNSRKYHPGNVKYTQVDGKPLSHNSEFNKYMTIYQKLFESK